MNRSIHIGKATPLFVATIALACLTFSPAPKAFGVVPSPDGGYPGGNTAEGQNALFSLTTGGYNTAIGYFSLKSDITNSFNTAVGAGALFANIADGNTATGAGALLFNTTGSQNTANGVLALFSNTIGSFNTAIGEQALFNTTGSQNTANGAEALYNNIGHRNTGIGAFALFGNTTGVNNTAVGRDALLINTVGSHNTVIGHLAGSELDGDGNVCIGANVLGEAGENDTTRIRNVYSSVASGRAVYVDFDNKIGTLSSSRRVKKNIKPMDKASEAILALKPVSFQYKKELDASGTAQFGLIAEEVAEIDSELVTRDAKGKPETVRYEAVNAMLLNEFLKEHRKVAKLEATVAEQQKQIKVLMAGLQQVSDQLELSSPAPQIVNNDW